MQNDLQWEVAYLQAAEVESLPMPPAGMSVAVIEEADSMGFPRVSVCGPDRDTVLAYVRENWGDDEATGGWYSEYVVAGIRPVGVAVTASIAKAKKEILKDVAAGHVPATITSFSDLHEYMDANEYGGLTEEYFDLMDEDLEFPNAVQGEVDKWIKAGGHAPGDIALLTRVENAWYELTKGELNLTEDADPDEVALVRAMVKSAREIIDTVDTSQFGPGRNEIDVVDDNEIARRVAVSLSTLHYGIA